MGDIVTMDDLTNQDIVAVLDDAERLVPVARGDVYLPLLQGKVPVSYTHLTLPTKREV